MNPVIDRERLEQAERLAQSRPTEWAREASKGIEDCEQFLLLIPETVPLAESIECRLQLATAIAHDKPIFVVCPASASVPATLHKIARRVAFYRDGDRDDFQRAIVRVQQELPA